MRTLLNRFARRTLLAVACLCAAGTTAWASGSSSSGGDPDMVSGEILVKLRSTGALDPLVARYPVEVMDQFGSRPIYRLRVTDGGSVADRIAALSLETDVLIVEPNATQQAPEARKNVVWAIGNPSAYAAQWAPKALRLAEAQKVYAGAGMRIAVLDTGVDASHPALAGRLLPGFDFVDWDTDPSEAGDDYSLGYGHGTHVAGLIAMVAPAAKIIPLRVLDANGQGNTWVLSEALLYAINPDGNPATDDGAHVINLSLGTLTRTRILDAVTQLATCTFAAATDPANDLSDPGYDEDFTRCDKSRGVIIVAAAGNDASAQVREYPAAEQAHGLVAVGASAANARLATFSNSGSWVRFTAPGDGITSAIPGGDYATWSGTSMAAPFAAGAAALVRGVNRSMKPDEVIRRLADRAATLCGTNLRQIDVAAAVTDKAPPATLCP